MGRSSMEAKLRRRMGELAAKNTSQKNERTKLRSFFFFSFFLKVLFLVSFGLFTFAQQEQKPLTQAEYVKLLYELEKNPRKRDEIINTVRTRGIDFELTDGIRGLTATKSRNDSELRRVLEEVARKRKNPELRNLPDEKESALILEQTRKATLAAIDEMPDFIVKQVIQRSISFAGTNNFQTIDRLVVAVSYRANGYEEYRVLSINGVIQDNPRPKQTYEEVGGTSSTGEFVSVLATIFKPESNTQFRLVDSDSIDGRRSLVYEYSVEKEKARQKIIASGYFYDTAVTGMKGRIWIDRENFRVLRLESEATEIPAGFPIRAASRRIDYDWVTIAGEKYLLPVLADVRLTVKQEKDLLESRNLIRFREYQKFGTEVRILEEDLEEKPN